MKVDEGEGSDQKSDIWPHWMAAHACLKNVFTQDEKYHNHMKWLKLWKIMSSFMEMQTDNS